MVVVVSVVTATVVFGYWFYDVDELGCGRRKTRGKGGNNVVVGVVEMGDGNCVLKGYMCIVLFC